MSVFKRITHLLSFYTLVVFVHNTVVGMRQSQNFVAVESKGSLLVRNKRMGGGDLIDRCWEGATSNLASSAVTIHGNCIYRNREEYTGTCYYITESSGNYEKDDLICNEYDEGYERGEANNILALDEIAILVNSANLEAIGDEYWIWVTTTLKIPSSTSSGCNTNYNEDFNIDDRTECTYLRIEEDGYKVRKRMCDDDKVEGLICQKEIEPIATLPTTKTRITDAITTRVLNDHGVSSTKSDEIVTLQQKPNPERNSSNMSDVVIPISTALAVAVVCIIILVIFILCRRRTNNNGTLNGSGHVKTNPSQPETEPRYEEKIISNTNTPSPYSSYGKSLPGDYAYLDTANKEEPNSITVENELYHGGTYEYPMLPVSKETAELKLNDDSYDSLGPHYYVLNREEEEGEKSDSYIEVTNGTEKQDEEYSYPYVDFKK